MFGEAFLTHTMLCFTKYATDPKSVRQRQSGGKKKDTHIIAEYQKLFYDRYNQFMLKSDQFMFIDSIVDNDEDADENEQLQFATACNRAYSFMAQCSPFSCADIQEVTKERDQLRAMIDRLTREHEQVIYEMKEEQKKIRREVEKEVQAKLQKENDDLKREIEALRLNSQYEEESKHEALQMENTMLKA